MRTCDSGCAGGGWYGAGGGVEHLVPNSLRLAAPAHLYYGKEEKDQWVAVPSVCSAHLENWIIVFRLFILLPFPWHSWTARLAPAARFPSHLRLLLSGSSYYVKKFNALLRWCCS